MTAPIPVLTQDAKDVHLALVAGDPISFAFYVADVDWSGGYDAHVRFSRDEPADVEPLLALAVTAVFDVEDNRTLFTLTAPASANTLKGRRYFWDLQQVGGVTRLSGEVRVRGQVTQ